MTPAPLIAALADTADRWGVGRCSCAVPPSWRWVLGSQAARALTPRCFVPALIERLADTEGVIWHVCDEAAIVLRHIGTPEAVAAVEEWKRNGRGRG
ncbi:MAG: hypothetical protein H6672_05575 [Anaerolineaceae bacterium]|nr:hypothetical protein [Anaerolineaceae bacterium]